jgi:hypothetical protein
LDFLFCFFFVCEGNLLRECQMKKHYVCLLGKAFIVHSFTTPPKTYPPRKEYRQKPPKNRPNTLKHLPTTH